MESLTLSNVSTIMGILRDILSAVETASQNKSRCKKIAKRVRCIKDILEALHAAPVAVQDGTAADTATQRLLDRLEDALSSALEVVRQCQRSSSVVVIVASGRMADLLDGVEADMDRCIIDLTLANSLRIARLETLLVRGQQHTVAAAASTEDDGEKDDEDKRKKGSAEGVVLPDTTTDHDESTTATAIGVPVSAVPVHEHRHEMMLPPSSYGYYGYCYSCRSYHLHSNYYWRNHGCACDYRDDDRDAGGPSSGATLYHTTQYTPSMFSDDDPNSCSIM